MNLEKSANMRAALNKYQMQVRVLFPKKSLSKSTKPAGRTATLVVYIHCVNIIISCAIARFHQRIDAHLRIGSRHSTQP